MHRRHAAVSPLPALSIPRSREMSALLSSTGSAPHTPTKRADPLPLFTVNTNRYSTDSWNSSNLDVADEMECEWKPEHIRFLNRTLDNLPSHLLTPFIGPVPPSNLLDKIARRVSDTKGNEWPHSMRATRAKLVELGRTRAKEARDDTASDTIAEEGSGTDEPLKPTTNISLKRPLYRQSSMDFMKPAKPTLKDNSNISRLSRRLQRTDRILTSPSHNASRPTSPMRGPPSLHPSTPSSTTLNSGMSTNVASRDRRSLSSLSSASDQPLMMPIRRVRRSETLTGSSLYAGLKRAPSFGGSSRNSLESAMSIDFNAKDSDVTSSDEEEKLRSKKAKRARRKIPSPTPTSPAGSPMASPMVISPPARPVTRSRTAAKTPSTATPKQSTASKPSPTMQTRSSRPKTKANLARNPSILGGELPCPQPDMEPPAVVRANQKRRMPRESMQPPASPSVHHAVPPSPYNLTHIPPVTPHSGASKTLRRSRVTAPLPRVSLARKISFNNATATLEGPNGPSGAGLESAFQLH